MSVDTNMQITCKHLNSDLFNVLPTFFSFLEENGFTNQENLLGKPVLNTRFETSFDKFGINGSFPLTINGNQRNIFIIISTALCEGETTDGDQNYYVYFNLHYDNDSVEFFKKAADYMRKHLPQEFKVWLRECDVVDEFSEVA